MDDRFSNNMRLWFFLAFFLLSLLLLGWLLWPFISIIILAMVVAGLFNPIFKLLTQSQKVSQSVGSLITCVIVFFALFVPIVLCVGILSKEAFDLYQTGKSAFLNPQIKSFIEGSDILERVNLFLARFDFQITGEELNRAISEIGKAVGLFLYQQARAIASNTFAFLVNFFLMLLVIYFMLLDGSRLVAFISDLSPLPPEQDDKLINKFKDMARSILLVNGLAGIIQGLLGGIVFYIFGLESPVLWGVIMGGLAFLPIVGIGIVFVPAAVLLGLKGQIATGIFFFVFYVFLSGGIEYLLKPKLVGQRVKMHTLLVFFSIIGGLKLFGILGIIYGPLVVTAFLTLADIYHSSYQQYIDTSGIGGREAEEN